MIEQRSAEWHELRRRLITATDLPAILGIDPWRSEGDVARRKLGLAEEPDPGIPARVGTALEPLIAQLYAEQTGRAVTPHGGIAIHPELPWAGASPDYVAEDRLVEVKWSGSRRAWAAGLPQHYECQVRWQLGVTGYPRADVAALVGTDLRVYEVEHDPALFDQLVVVAEDFRRRLEAGGPFSETLASIGRAFPRDDGTELVWCPDFELLVRDLLRVRAEIERLEADRDRLELAIKQRMGPAAIARGQDWRVTWSLTKDSERTDWRAVATELLRPLPPDERARLIQAHTEIKPGLRRFVLTGGSDDDD